MLFDMDGLLVDTEPLWFEVESAIMARLGGRWTSADQQHLVGGSLSRTVSYLLDRGTIPASPADVARWLTGGMADLIASRELHVMPGARELIDEITAAGLPVALVTSSEPDIMTAVTDRIGIGFQATVCAADVRRGKPDPEPYLLAARRLGADPRRCVALEDSPNGVASAEAAGCATIAVPGVAAIPARPGRLVVGSLTGLTLTAMAGLVGAAISRREQERDRLQ